MIEWAHGVECVRGADGAGGDGGPGFGGGGIGMADGDTNAATGGMRGEFDGPGQLRGKRHQAHVAMGSLDEAIEGGDAWGEEMFGRLHAALFVREERTFQVDSERARTAGLRQLGDFVGQAVERAESGVERRCDGGGEVGAGAARSEKRAHGIERLRRGFHYVVAGGAVDVHVEKCRAEGGAGKVEHLGAGRQSATSRASRWSRSCRLQ